MKRDVKIIYFSPTGTTGTIVRTIAAEIYGDTYSGIDITSSETREEQYSLNQDELVIIGMPVYAGRIPETVIPFIKRISAEGTPAVPVVVYGNRDYDDALLELSDLLTEAGCKVIAAGAFIGEHSYSREDAPIATGRPDNADLQEAVAFGRGIARKLACKTEESILIHDDIPGNRPYRDRMQFPPVNIPVDNDLCTACNICAEACPVDAIDRVDYRQDPAKCIICCACIKQCPENARWLQSKEILAVTEKLSEKCADRRDPETYF
jgi:ferredoxin